MKWAIVEFFYKAKIESNQNETSLSRKKSQ